MTIVKKDYEKICTGAIMHTAADHSSAGQPEADDLQQRVHAEGIRKI
jgi:hypothetical protein